MNSNVKQILEEKGIFIKDKNVSNKIAVVFPGHGAQYLGMFQKLYENVEEIKNVFDRAENIYQKISGKSLLNQVFSTEENAEANLLQPTVMQPSIVMADVAMYEYVLSQGYKPDYVIGHSLGEIAALCASNVISIEEAIEIAYRRAEAVSVIPLEKRGGMISIGAKYSKELGLELIEAGGQLCEVSIINSNNQFNISGPTKSLEKIKKYCESRNINATILHVSHAFHSKLMEPSLDPYQMAVKEFKFKKPEIPVYSTILSRLYKDEMLDSNKFAEILASQLVTPFSFQDIITSLVEDYSVGTFIECGPKDIMTKLIKTIAGDKAYTLSTNRKKHDEMEELENFGIKAECLEIKSPNKNKTEGKDMNDIINIFSYETMYPVNVFSNIEQPVFHYYAITEQIKTKLIALISQKYELNLSEEEWNRISLSDLEKKVAKEETVENVADKNVKPVEYKAIDKNVIKDYVLYLIEKNTGYPQDMLEENLDFEADLGIDSVKQGEILAEVQEKYQYEVLEGESVKELSTVTKVVDYVAGKLNASAKNSEVVMTNDKEEAESLNQETKSVDKEEIKEYVLNVIEKNTGYPQDMLEDELDFEADLGIDSVKQGEILVEVQEKYQYEVLEGESVKELSTVSKVVEYVADKLGSEESLVGDSEKKNKHERSLLGDFNSNRYVSTTMKKELPKKTNFTLKGKSFLLVADEEGNLTAELYKQLKKKAEAVKVISEYKIDGIKKEDLTLCQFDDREDLKKAAKTIKNDAKTTVVINLAAVRKSNFEVETMNASEWKKQCIKIYDSNFYITKAVYENLEENKEKSAYFAVTNIGGIFGMEKGYEGNPVGAISAGFVKALEKELRPFNCKVIDFTDVTDAENTASTILSEIGRIEKLVEVGYDIDGRKVVEVLPKEIREDAIAREVENEDVILVTGGGRGIIYECMDSLLQEASPHVIVTGRTPLEDESKKEMQMTDEEFAAYKEEYMKVQHATEPKKSPMLILRDYEKIANARKLLANITRWKNKGYDVEYVVCDAASPEDMKNLVASVKQKYGKITGIVNGAGLPSFGKIPKKDEKFAEKVVEVKANSSYVLMKECIKEPLKFYISMGSISGRFGMDGQVDYSAAADLIVRMTMAISQKKPETRFTVIGWSAWDEVGMASGEQVKKVQQEKRGLEYLSVKEGRNRFLNEIFFGGNNPEVLVFGKLGNDNLPLGQLDALDETGKHIASNTDQNEEIVIDRIKYPMIEKVVSLDDKKIQSTKSLNVYSDIHLQDHRVEGKHVFAGVMHVETACEMLEMFLEKNGLTDYTIQDISGFNFYKFIKVFKKNPLELKLEGIVTENTENEIKMHVTIKSDFVNNKGMIMEADRLHSEGDIIATKEISQTKKMKKEYSEGTEFALDKYYESAQGAITFGDSFRCIHDVELLNENEIIGKVTVPIDGQYFSFTRYADTIISPVTIDNIGRLMLFREFNLNGNTIVPTCIEEAKQFRQMIPGEELDVFCRFESEDGMDVYYSAYATDQKGNLVFDIKNMRLRRINQYKGNHSLCEEKEEYFDAV